MSIIIGADLVPTASNAGFFAAGDANALVGEELCRILKEADYRIFNLEVPLADAPSPIRKQGPTLIAPTNTAAGYGALGTDLLTLANNHILDQGEAGLRSTIKTLDQAEIGHIGAGMNLQEASGSVSFSFAGRTVGVYACAEHEFSIARENSCGANPIDPLYSLDHVADLKEKADYVIVLYHGGKELYRYPTPGLQKICRRLTEKGADLVICQHSHCIGCAETYKGSVIIYGQGNFLFDNSMKEEWKTSLLVTVDDDLKVDYVPLVKEGCGVRAAKGDAAESIIKGFCERSEQISEAGFVENEFRRLAEQSLGKYLYALGGSESTLFRILNRLSGGLLRGKKMENSYGENKRIAIRNYIECETHRELLLKGIENSYE